MELTLENLKENPREFEQELASRGRVLMYSVGKGLVYATPEAAIEASDNPQAAEMLAAVIV